MHFLGEQDQLEPLLACADLFLLPSEQESFGLTALEAMNCGVPVIATDIGGLPELIAHDETGYLFPIGETERMAEAAAALLRNHEQHERFGRKARDRAVQGFNANQIIPQYEAFYEEVLQRLGGSSAPGLVTRDFAKGSLRCRVFRESGDLQA